MARPTIDRGHDESDLGGIGGTGEMGINLLRLVLVQADESVQDVVAGQGIVVSTFIVGEVVLHWADRKLLLETIDLVQEQNYRGLDEPSRVANRVEKGEGFLHTVDGLIFKQKLIVLGNSNEEKDGGDILEAVDPLLALRTLSSDVKHAVCKVSNDECCLSNTGSLYTGAQNILVVGHVVGLGDALNIVKVAVSRTCQWPKSNCESGLSSLTIVQSRSTDTLSTA